MGTDTQSDAPGTGQEFAPHFLAPGPRPCAHGTNALRVAASAGLPLKLDVPMAKGFLWYRDVDSHRSFIENIALIPPLSSIRDQGDGTYRVRRGRAPPRRDLTEIEAAHALRSAIDHATEQAVRPWGRIGIWLSGGVDSSILTAATVSAWRRLGRDPADILAYHLLVADGEGELALARGVAHELGIELEVVPMPAGDPFADAEMLLGKMDLPQDTNGPAMCIHAANRMREDGIELFLTGDGGDEVFGVLSPTSVSGRLRTALRDHTPLGVRQGLSRHEGPPWVLPTAPRPHHIQSWPRARRGLRGEAARRDRDIRRSRQTLIVAYLRAVAEIAEAHLALPLLDPSVANLAVCLAPAHLAARPGKKVARAAYADLLPRYDPPPKDDQPSLTGPIVTAARRYGAAWAERWIRGGVAETAGVVSPGAGPELMKRAGEGSGTDLFRALALLGLEIYSRARLGMCP